LNEFIELQYQASSPLFQRWLTAEEFGELFGPNPGDIRALTEWLTSQGFQVNSVSKSGLAIDFPGDAGQVNAVNRGESRWHAVHEQS
jgi:subtilase family serine protease